MRSFYLFFITDKVNFTGTVFPFAKEASVFPLHQKQFLFGFQSCNAFCKQINGVFAESISTAERICIADRYRMLGVINQPFLKKINTLICGGIPLSGKRTRIKCRAGKTNYDNQQDDDHAEKKQSLHRTSGKSRSVYINEYANNYVNNYRKFSRIRQYEKWNRIEKTAGMILRFLTISF